MEEIPLKPLGKDDIKKLELALIVGTLFRQDVLEQAIEVRDKLTWLDSLIVAAGALARERAGIPISKIADELGRTESTIRNHLSGKTDAGKMVSETYNRLVKQNGKLEISISLGADLKEKLNKCEDEVQALKTKHENLKKKLEELINML